MQWKRTPVQGAHFLYDSIIRCGNWFPLLIICISLLLSACQSASTSEQKKHTTDQKTRLISEVYYRELADLEILPLTISQSLGTFTVKDPLSYRKLDYAIGAIDQWADNKPYIFHAVNALDNEQRQQIAPDAVVMKVEEVYAKMLVTFAEMKDKLFIPVAESLSKNNKISEKQGKKLVSITTYTKQLQGEISKYKLLHKQKNYMYDTSVFNEDLLTTLENVDAVLDKIEESVNE